MVKIKEVRDIETNQLQGYNYNNMFVPIESSNRHYQEIQQLIKEGKATILPSFTEEERIKYFQDKLISQLKQIRQSKVDNIVVEIILSDGTTIQLDGDETSQERMSRVISILQDDTTQVPWIDHNNQLQMLTKSQLQEALYKAGQEQANIFKTYQILREQIWKINDIEKLKNAEIDWNNSKIIIPEDNISE